MLNRKSFSLIAALVTLALVTFGDRKLLSVPPRALAPPGGSSVARWTFTYPVDGAEISGPAAFIGTGPSNSTAMLSIYTQENTIPGGVYETELTLKATRLVDTVYSDVWSSEAYGYAGLWFATIIPHNLAEDGGSPVLEVMPMLEVSTGDPSTDLDSLATITGGDAVSYRIRNMGTP